jgi:hypothetical protein
MITNDIITETTNRSEYKRQWAQNERFRKWLIKHTGVVLKSLTSDDMELLRREYLSCPMENGRAQLTTLNRLVVRANRLVSDYDFTLSDALRRSRDIEHLLTSLHQGEVCFSYLPFSTGEERLVCGTLASEEARRLVRRQSPQSNVIHIAFIDTETGSWRSMNAANYIGIYGE